MRQPCVRTDMSSSLPNAEAANRLIHEKSPYLLQHARNPVDWHPWGEEAFALARKLDRPIFLSVGYSTCHWCHVMARESFEHAGTAELMNALFVNVKLDREERPDVDRVYMTFVQATTGGGGWPMSVWLQPDLKPIVGGTYFPPDDRYGRRGFPAVCRAVGDAWRDERAKVVAQGERIIKALRDHTRSEATPAPAGRTGPTTGILQVLDDAGSALAQAFDPEWGGFGDAPKFPRPVTLALLARIQAHLPRDPQTGADGMKDHARGMLLSTLDHMAAGGMYDHLGGGFHRYSVDRRWHVPHFEKMLYDQAQLIVAYLEGYQISGRPEYAEVARATLAYVRRDLASPEGGFFCAEDADSLLATGRPEHAEGAFYVWTQAEIVRALTPEESAAFCVFYGVQAAGNAPAGSDPQGEFTGKNILFVHPPFADRTRTPPGTAERLARARAKLLQRRNERPRPHLDDKIVTAWNGLMISALARAAGTLGDPAYLQQARRCAGFIRQHLYDADSGILRRSYREGAAAVEGFAEDYAFLIQGLLDLFAAGFDAAHLEWAERLQARQDELFYDRAGGGYFSASERDPSVLLRIKEDHDGAEPSARAVSALNLARLAALTDRNELRQRALACTRAFGTAAHPQRGAHSMPLMLAAVDALSRPHRQIVIAGRPDAADTQKFLAAIGRTYLPDTTELRADGGDGQRALAGRMPYLANVSMQDGRATAYLCEHGACQLPTHDPEELLRRMKSD